MTPSALAAAEAAAARHEAEVQAIRRDAEKLVTEASADIAAIPKLADKTRLLVSLAHAERRLNALK